MKHLFTTLIFIFAASNINAQKITNVKAKLSSDNKTIIVSYNIEQAKKGDKYNVSLWISKDYGSYKKLYDNELTGDYGKFTANTGGTLYSKRITYDPLKYNERLQGNIEFEVRASVTSGGSIEMVFIKGGTFTMGSPTSEANRGSDETQHRVTVSDFYIGKYEVTFEEYDKFCNATGRTKPKDEGWGRGKRPVINVSWNDATAYCKWLSNKTGQNYRLPTEAEWEYACRAGTTTTFNTGNCLSTNQANYNGNYPYKSCRKGTYRKKTTTAGSFSPNAWGIYDMHGNVWEWCSDWYGSYNSGSQTNPPGASTGSGRVYRGGSWYYIAGICRSAYRFSNGPGHGRSGLGFRPAFVP